VIAGVLVLAAAAFVISYPGIHQIALSAGVAPELARLYPVIFDAMIVAAGAAALALRGAGWWPRAYAWSSLLLTLTAVAVGDALHATNVTLPAQPTRAVLAVMPWVLLLLAFGLWLEMLRHLRRMRATSAQQGPGQPATTGQGVNGVTGNGNYGAGQRAAVTWAGAGGAGQGRPLPPPLSGLDALLGPREEPAPAMSGVKHDASQYSDPVSYGEETGYVHPESYLGLGDHSAGSPAASADPGAAGPAAAGPSAGLAEAPPVTGAAAATGAAPAADTASADAPPATNAAPVSGAAPAGAVPPTAAAAATGAAPAQAPPATEGPQPPAKKDAKATAQAVPAGQAAPDSGSGTTPETAPGLNPPLERLRSTPAPPNE
jgi:hypothetical protein